MIIVLMFHNIDINGYVIDFLSNFQFRLRQGHQLRVGKLQDQCGRVPKRPGGGGAGLPSRHHRHCRGGLDRAGQKLTNESLIGI